MYPGIPVNRDIKSRKTKAFPFKESEDSLASQTQVVPAVNISETNNGYFIILAAPGLKRDDFKIEINQLVLTITAKKECNTICGVIDRSEYDYTDWTRAFILPADADTLFAKGEYQNGELLIYVPRSNSCDNEAKTTICVY